MLPKDKLTTSKQDPKEMLFERIKRLDTYEEIKIKRQNGKIVWIVSRTEKYEY